MNDLNIFNLGENIIEFDKHFNKVNALRVSLMREIPKFGDRLKRLEGPIQESKSKDFLYKLIFELPQNAQEKLTELVKFAIDLLVEFGVYDCDETVFIKKYQQEYFEYENQPAYIKLKEKYIDIEDECEKIHLEREYAKINRKYFTGGGFGFSALGAIKGAIGGMIIAGGMNIASAVVHGIGDSVNDAAVNSACNKKYNSLLQQEAITLLADAFANCLMGIIFACEQELFEKKGIECCWDYEESVSKASSMFNNAVTRCKDSRKALKIICEAIQISPYNFEFYRYLYTHDGYSKEEVKIIAEFLGFSMEGL